MTPIQYRRWRRLAAGLAKHGFEGITDARREKIADEVTHIIFCIVRAYPMGDIHDWDGNRGSVYVCDYVDERLSEHYHTKYTTDKEKGNRFLAQVRACVRAGFDVAVEPSAGVIWFTVGDLRSIFPNGLPEWVQTHFESPITDDVPDNIKAWL
jgi:hypothetical protein